MLVLPHKFRVLLLGAMFCLLAGLVGARLYMLQVASHERFLERASNQQTKRVVVQAERGDILDRNGRPLATSTGTLSIYVDTKYFKAPHADVDLDAVAEQVAYYCNLDPETISARFERNGVVPLGRQLDPQAAQRVGQLLDEYEITRRGFWFHRESKRLYPRHLAPHVIGFTGTDGDGDNVGLGGLELKYNDTMMGRRVETTASRSAISQVLQPVHQEDILAARGHSLILTLDAAIQETAENAVADAAAEFEADAAGAVVIDVMTGEVLALASWPTFDNSEQGNYPADYRRNRILTDPLETGSVAKLFTAAILLDTGKISIDTLVDCEGGRAVVDGRRLTDSPGHYLDVVPFYEVIRHSSNVGTVKAAQVLENNEWYAYLRAFGFGESTGIDLGGEGVGLLYPVSRWTKFSRTSLPMGYEMALTPVQICSAIGSLVNGGDLMQPYIVKEIRDSRGNVVERFEPTVRRHVIRPSTSELMRRLMEDVVLNGTGKKAQVPGFRVGGKTGTTVKSHIHTHKEYIASFGGALPIQDPKIAVYVFVDNPHGKHYASEVAAPVFQKIARSATLQLGLVPTEFRAEDDIASSPDLAPFQPLLFPQATALEAGTMPNLAGLSMAEVRSQLPAQLERVRFIGSGRAADQTPPAGQSIDSNSDVIVVFSPDAPRALTPADALVAQSPRRNF
ncbi:PASTA domain-containing protein [bacterium]|nr:PASTA domain-containing protein [bacterium]